MRLTLSKESSSSSFCFLIVYLSTSRAKALVSSYSSILLSSLWAAHSRFLESRSDTTWINLMVFFTTWRTLSTVWAIGYDYLCCLTESMKAQPVTLSLILKNRRFSFIRRTGCTLSSRAEVSLYRSAQIAQ